MTTLHWVSLRTFINEPSIELGRRIAGLTDAGLQTSFFVSSGSEAVESATQLAKSYHRAKGSPERTKFLYRKTGYHGTTLVGASASDNQEFRTWFAPLAPGFVELEACYPYRRPDGMTEEEYGDACADAIEATILAEGPETIAGILAESIPAASCSCRRPTTCAACARSATGTTSCGSTTRCSSASGARAAGSASSTSG